MMEWKRAPIDSDSSPVTRQSKSITWTTVALSCFVVFLLAVFGLEIKRRNSNLLPSQSFYGEVPTTSMIFETNLVYESTDAAAEKAWDDMIPLGGGYVRVPNPRRFDMPPSSRAKNSTTNEEVYATSVTHQLHCLGMLREALISGKPMTDEHTHLYHCLNYLRQGIICAADTTLEWAKWEYGPDGSVVAGHFDGIGAIHQCRDWSLIKAQMVEKRGDDRTGILGI